MKNIILDSGDIKNKIKRISIEIIEKNLKEEEIYIFGVLPNGKYLSEQINIFFKKNSKIKFKTFFIEIDKTSLSINKIIPEPNPIKLKNKVIILFDDVINSGATLMYSINKLLDYSPKEIQIAVLIERNYKSFPLTPDFKGLELSTAKSEHVEVSIDKSPKVLIK